MDTILVNQIWSGLLAELREVLRQNWPSIKTFWNGYREYEKTGMTPDEAYYAMRHLFVQTNGLTNDFFQSFYGCIRPGKRCPKLNGSLFTGLTNREVALGVEQLKQDGYYVFPRRLPQVYIDALLEYGLNTPAVLKSAECSDAGQAKFDPERLMATNYMLPESGVVNNPTVQKIMADPLLISFARKYIGSQTAYVNTQLWWTTPHGCGEPQSSLAQLYHFDMDRIKFMKFFVYLTDVDGTSGPHCYIRGSCHKKPEALLKDRRFTDDEVKAHFDAKDLVEITAPKGTLMAVDTRGFHKAKVPTAGNRLILQVEVAGCLFGQNYPHVALEPRDRALKDSVNRDPYLWSNYNVVSLTTAQPKNVLVAKR